MSDLSTARPTNSGSIYRSLSRPPYEAAVKRAESEMAEVAEAGPNV